MALGNHRQKFQYPFQKKCLYDESCVRNILWCGVSLPWGLDPTLGCSVCIWSLEMADILADIDLLCVAQCTNNLWDIAVTHNVRNFVEYN